MDETRCRIAQRLLAVAVFVALAGRCTGSPLLDASNDVGGGSAALYLISGQFLAQSFTVTTDGLLSQVDVQVGKYAGATGDVRFELRPLVGGAPTTDDAGMLYVTTININDIPVIGSLSDPPPFVSVDVSDAGIHAKPGEAYAISLRRSGSTPAAAWRSRPNFYPGGTGFSRSLLTSPWSQSIEDFGFQTWIDPTPTAPYKLRVDPTFDVQYRPGTVSSLIEGEEQLIIGGIPGHATLPEQRPIIEFPLADLPADAVIQGAHLELDWYVSSGDPRIEIIGFAGDGLASFADATTAGTLLTITGPTTASSSSELPIDASFVASLIGQASHLGVRIRSLDLPEYVGFYALEDDFSTALPPRLVIEYTLPLAGDFNLDGVVDAADYTVWRDGLGTTYTEADYDVWRSHFGQTAGGSSGASTNAAVPEPETLALLILAAAGLRLRRDP